MIKPYGKRLLINAKIEKIESKFGIIIPDSVKELRPSEGTVVAAGPGCEISEGEYVLYNDFTGKAVEWDGEEFLIIEEEEVIAIIEE